MCLERYSVQFGYGDRLGFFFSFSAKIIIRTVHFLLYFAEALLNDCL